MILPVSPRPDWGPESPARRTQESDSDAGRAQDHRGAYCRAGAPWPWPRPDAEGSDRRIREQFLGGLIRDGEPPDTYPGQILAKVFRRWLETEGALPDASRVATACIYVLDPAGRNRPILAEEDRLRWVGPECRERVATPRLIEVAGLPGVSFWWVRSEGDSEVRVYLAEGENVRVEEMFGRDHPTKDKQTRGQ